MGECFNLHKSIRKFGLLASFVNILSGLADILGFLSDTLVSVSQHTWNPALLSLGAGENWMKKTPLLLYFSPCSLGPLAFSIGKHQLVWHM